MGGASAHVSTRQEGACPPTMTIDNGAGHASDEQTARQPDSTENEQLGLPTRWVLDGHPTKVILLASVQSSPVSIGMMEIAQDRWRKRVQKGDSRVGTGMGR